MIKSRLVIPFLILLFVLTGLVLRLGNLSSFRLYPDSYQNLLVAANLRHYGQVIGRLGPEGMLYPDFLSWTRPVYASLINLGLIFVTSPVRSAQLAALINGLMAIPLVFLAARSLFRSHLIALMAALLLSVSFNHIVWGGYILTETTGVMLLTFFLWLLFKDLSSPTVVGRSSDLLAGLVFAVAVLSRYEYLALVLPVTMLIRLYSPTPFSKIVTIFTTALVALLVAVAALYPPPLPLLRVLIREAEDSWTVFLAAVVIFSLMLGLSKIATVKRSVLSSAFLDWLILVGLAGFALLIFFQLLIGPGFTFLWYPLTAPRDFFQTDFLIGLLFLTGSLVMLKTRFHLPLLYFCLLSLTLLGAVYGQINMEMQRYWTHLLPFLVIPSAVGFRFLLFHPLRIFRVLVILLLLFQLNLSRQGLKSWRQGAWFNRPNYEQAVIDRLPSKLSRHRFLLVSLPEPYYFSTSQNVYSYTNRYPFIYIPPSLDNQNFLIIQDAGTYHLFPNFSRFIQKNLQPYKKTELYTGLDFYLGAEIYPEDLPVRIYEIRLSELKMLLDKYQPDLNL